MNQIEQLFAQNFSRRQKYLERNKIEAYRLYNLEAAFLPIAIDIYRENAVIHVFRPVAASVLTEVEAILKELLQIQNFFYKNRTQSARAHADAGAGAIHSPTHKELIITEYGHKFLINLSSYLDTGLFLDHRETRRFIAAHSKNKIVLNTFAYTGSFSVYAAASGAAKTCSVDLSKTYCDWIKENLRLNHLPPAQNWVYKMDTFEFFHYAKRKNLQFDIIIIDPPTFSRNKGKGAVKSKTFSVQKDHPALINLALEVLAPHGFILFSNNFHEFRLQKEKIGIGKTGIAANCKIREKQDTIPPDFIGPRPHHCFIISRK